MLLTHGFSGKRGSGKTPRREINQAKEVREEYLKEKSYHDYRGFHLSSNIEPLSIGNPNHTVAVRTDSFFSYQYLGRASAHEHIFSYYNGQHPVVPAQKLDVGS